MVKDIETLPSFDKWAAYLLGHGANTRIQHIGQRENIHFLKTGVDSVIASMRAGSDPMEMARFLHHKGYRYKDLVSTPAYEHIATTSTVVRGSTKYVFPLITESAQKAYAVNGHNKFSVLDLGCGPGYWSERIIQEIRAGLPQDVTLLLRQEDSDPLAVFVAAMRAIELMEKYEHVEITVDLNNMTYGHPKDKCPADMFIGLLSMLSYISIAQQEQVIQRLNSMGVRTGVLTGLVNNFDTIVYLKTGYVGHKTNWLGLKYEARSITGLDRLPLRPREFVTLIKTMHYMLDSAIPLAKHYKGIYPDLSKVVAMYYAYGWQVQKRHSFVPLGVPTADIKTTKGAVLALAKAQEGWRNGKS